MEISPALLLVPYLAAMLLVVLISCFALYRLVHFGSLTAGSWLMITVFIIGMLATFALTAAALAQFDWSASSPTIPTLSIPAL